MAEGTGRLLARKEKLSWLRLIRSQQVGPVTFRLLLERFGSAEKALDALPELAQRGGRKGALKVASLAEAERELSRLEELGGSTLALGEPDYPPGLAALSDAPPLLFYRGHSHLLKKSSIALVGARNASAAGRKLAEDLARDLAAGGLVVASGLARGIDAAAHKGAIKDGTIAVIAGGLDVVYPPEHEDLTARIDAEGLLLTEMPCGHQPIARNFPQRNRLVAGLSLGVVVVEAAVKSGSLITARFALEQGREVMAVPGSPLDPRCQGGNLLIRQGATLVQSAADIFESLGDLSKAVAREPSEDLFTRAAPLPISESELEKARREITLLLSPTPTAVDEVIRQCQFSPPVVQMVLLELELAGRLERHPGGRITLLF